MILTSLTEENSAGFIYGFVNNKKEKDKDVAYISKEFSTTALKFVEIYNTIEALEKSKDFQENKYILITTFKHIYTLYKESSKI